jgi:hypothetical protein
MSASRGAVLALEGRPGFGLQPDVHVVRCADEKAQPPLQKYSAGPAVNVFGVRPSIVAVTWGAPAI